MSTSLGYLAATAALVATACGADDDGSADTALAVGLVGSAPHTMALLTVCGAKNRRQVVLAKSSTIGSDVETPGTGDLQAYGRLEDVRLTPNGWRLWETQELLDSYAGSDVCAA